MDLSGFDIVAFATCLGSFIGAYKSATKASAAQKKADSIAISREITKMERDTKIALLERGQEEMQRRMLEDNGRFEKIEEEQKETNKALWTIVGLLKRSKLVTESDFPNTL